MAELKPCPFCGGKAEFKINHCAAYVECKECEASTDHILESPMYCAKDKAVEAWNRRTGKRGHWITNPYMLNRQKCSECGFWSDDLQADNYCPACGADMRGEIKT